MTQRGFSIPIIALFIAFLALPGQGQAADSVSVTIANRTLTLEVPAGACALDKNKTTDVPMITFMETSNQNLNRVLLVFAECGELADWRTGKLLYLNHYGYMATPVALMNQSLNITQLQVNNELRPHFSPTSAAMTEAMAEGKSRANNALDDLANTNAQVNETKILGVLEEDINGIYVGAVVGLNVDGEAKKNLGVFSTTLIKDKLVYIYQYEQHTGESGQFDRLLSWVKATSVQQKALNP
ncbi:MAG: hypothetical protein ACPGO3_00635 [Magnetospiraceae bacterium]